MNKNETANLLNWLCAVYPKAKIEDPVAMLDAWTHLLADYKEEDIKLAAERHAKTNRFFPEVSELIQSIIPAHYDQLGIPEDPFDSEEFAKRLKKALAVQRDHLGRDLTEDEYIQVKSEVAKVYELRRKYKRGEMK